MKPHLLFVHDSFAYRGGGEQMLLRVARAARDGGFGVSLALLWADDDGVLTEEERSLFGKIHRVRFPNHVGVSTLLRAAAASRELRRLALAGGYDAIVSFSLRPALRVAAAVGRRVPTAWMCQQSFPLFDGAMVGLKTWLGHRTLRRAGTRLVAISQQTVDIAARVGLGPATLIRNGIDVARFEATAALRDNAPRPFTVACVARLDPIKNHGVLIRALAQCRDKGLDARLLLVGGAAPHAPEYARGLRELADNLRVADQIVWVGEVSDPRPWLAQADVAALTSHKEAMGLVLAEAAAAGLPLVGARVGGIPEVVRDGQSGITFAPDAADELADALISLSGNPERRRAMAEQGALLVRREFNAELQGQAWQRFLAELSHHDGHDAVTRDTGVERHASHPSPLVPATAHRG